MSNTPVPQRDSSPPARTRRSTKGRLARLCLKELRETLRDRRTIVTLILMPLLVYPLLSVAFQRYLVTAAGGGAQEYVVGMTDEKHVELLRNSIKLGAEVLDYRRARRAAAEDKPPREPDRPGSGDVSVRWVLSADAERDLSEGNIDVAVLMELRTLPGAPPGAEFARCELVCRESSANGKAAVRFIEDRLRAVNDRYVRMLLRQVRLAPEMPFELVRREVADAGTALSLTTLVPLILILMTVTGAVYPAIDLTAGERERGTLEALMAAPVPRLELLAAKYVAVVTVALLTALANLIAMIVTLVCTGLATVLFGDAGLPLVTMLEILALLLLFAAFFSAVLLALTSFARSFKEAQAYLIPLMLLALAPGILSLMPGLKLNGLLAGTPLVNIALLARDLIEGTADPLWAVVAIASTFAYALAALSVAARVFGADAILYGSEGAWSDLFRRPLRSRSAASVSGALLCLAVMLPCYVLVAGYLARLTDLTAEGKLAASGVATAVLFLVVPSLVAWLQRVPWRDGFQVQPAHPLTFLAAVVLGCTLWPIAHEIFLLNREIGLATLDEQQLQSVRQLLESWRDISPWPILIALSLAPAVCEEFFFRGYVLRALLSEASAVKGILLSAVLFGAFHVLASPMLAVERFLPSTFLGLVLGFVCWRTGSVVPGMVLHACHNGLLLIVVYYRDYMAVWDLAVYDRYHVPIRWLVVSAVGVVTGGFLLGRARRRPRVDAAAVTN